MDLFLFYSMTAVAMKYLKPTSNPVEVCVHCFEEKEREKGGGG